MRLYTAFLIAACLCAMLLFTLLGAYIQISSLQHTIATQKLILSVPGQDTIRFDCRRCGHEHNLSTNDSTQTNKKP